MNRTAAAALSGLALLIASFGLSSPCGAEGYPARPVRVIAK